METFSPGDFVAFTLVTDSVAYEVIATTERTITVRGTRQGRTIRTDRNGGAFPVVWTEVLPDPKNGTRVCRRRKDGTFRMADWAASLRPCATIDGTPVTRTDYSH